MTEIPSEGRDSVVEQRIKEENSKVQAEIDETDRQIEVIQALINRSFLLRLRQSLGRDFYEKRQLWGLGSRQSGLKYELENLPDRVAGQIKKNRRSYQLFWIRNFLGDPVDNDKYREFETWKFYLIERDFPYDGGGRNGYEKGTAELDEERRLRFPEDTMRGIQEALSSAGEVNLTLYDTSDPHPQMCHEALIDLFTKLGFALDESMRRGIAAMHADMSIDTHALDEFAGQSPFKSGWRFVREDWLNSNQDGSVSGYLRAQGDVALSGKKFSKGQSPEFNPVLSRLCREWEIPHLYAELFYRRNNHNQDVEIGLRLQKEINIVDAKAKISPRGGILRPSREDFLHPV